MKTKSKRTTGWQRSLVIAIPYVWLLLFLLLPLMIVFKLSLSNVANSIPPYSPQLSLEAGWEGFKIFFSELTSQSYSRLLNPSNDEYDPLNLLAYFSSVRIALISTALILLLGYPMAYGMARAPKSWQPILLMLVILPFFSSLLIRVYAWIGILKPEGFLNLVLSWIGVVQVSSVTAEGVSFVNPLELIDTEIAVVIGIVYSYFPFMVLPLYSTLEKMDDSLIEAARDLGCSALGAFWRVTLPLSIPGIVAGCLLVFIPAIGEYIVPELLGGTDSLMIGRQLVNEFEKNRDWPFASAFAVVLLIILIVPIVFYQRQQSKQLEAGL
jgi:putrescine transport system permease protein